MHNFSAINSYFSLKTKENNLNKQNKISFVIISLLIIIFV